MSKRVKSMLIEEIRDRVGESREMLVIDSTRLDGVSANRLRLALREREISMLTVPNRLAQKALERAGLTALNSALEEGPSTLVWGGEDIVALSKEIARWARELGKLEIKGGALEGSPLTAEDVDELSKSPSREELIGQIAGLALSPGAQLAGALLGPGGKVAGQVQAVSEAESEE